ncbi:ubiquitin carboxyl-terminal hydrolase [Sparassis latifolia]
MEIMMPGTSSLSVSHDQTGSPFSVIESDPGVFTSLIRKLGVQGLEVIEIYGIEPWDTDHLEPNGLIFCYLCTDDNDSQEDAGSDNELEDRDAQRVWFANQLSEDACASQAILNVLLNCPDIDIGEQLRDFHAFTEKMSSVMRGLAIANSPFIRNAQNSLARPADIRASLHAVAAATIETQNSKQKPQDILKLPPAKKRKASGSTSKSKQSTADGTDTKQESYHFIGYAHVDDKVWELDGLRKSGPLEVGEVDGSARSARRSWMDIVRPALRMKMEKYLRSAGEGEHIRFNLLAIVEDRYQKASDGLEMLKRERTALERRLNETFPDGWADKVDPVLLASSKEAFSTSVRPSSDGTVFSRGFGSHKMEKELAILEMPSRKLPGVWDECVRNAMSAKIAVEDEIEKSRNMHTEHIGRTFDYEPFIREFVTCLHNEALLEKALSQKAGDEDTNERPRTRRKARMKR